MNRGHTRSFPVDYHIISNCLTFLELNAFYLCCFLLTYKTAVYMLVNGIITRQKQQIQKNVILCAVHWQLQH